MGIRLRGRMRWLALLGVSTLVLGTPGLAAGADPANVAPTVTVMMSNYSPQEGQTVSAMGMFVDPEFATETYSCTVNYGEGPVVPGVIVSNSLCQGPEHLYQVTGSYPVTVTVVDSGGASGTSTTYEYFVNRAPDVVGLGLVGYHEVGRAGHATAAVEDLGSAVETYTCTSIDYGDGSPLQAGTWVPTGWSDGLPRCVFPDHVYTTAGTYELIAVVTDSGGASGSARFDETIAPSPVPTVSAPPDQTVHSAQDAYYSGWHDFNLGSFTDPAGSAGGPWTVPSSGATAPPTTWRLTLRAH